VLDPYVVEEERDEIRWRINNYCEVRIDEGAGGVTVLAALSMTLLFAYGEAIDDLW